MRVFTGSGDLFLADREDQALADGVDKCGSDGESLFAEQVAERGELRLSHLGQQQVEPASRPEGDAVV